MAPSGDASPSEKMADATPGTPEDIMARTIYGALEKLFNPRLMALEKGLEEASDGFLRLERENRAVAQRLLETEARLGAVSAGRRPKVHAPDTFDGKDKEKAEQFVQQITVAAKFESFDNDEQKILWAQTYLSGSAHAWASLITFGQGDEESRLRVDWDAWIAKFRDTFCSRDAARDAMRRLGTLVQGSRTITDYTTEFRELVSKLPILEQTGSYIDGRYWDGLSLANKEHLSTTDFKSAAEAQEILLRRESRLADIAAQAKRSGGGFVAHRSAAAPSTPAPSVPHRAAPQGHSQAAKSPVAAPPPPSRDPNAMDVDGARRRAPTCFRCGGTGHRRFECTSDVMAQLKAGIIEEITKSLTAANVTLPPARISKPGVCS